MKAILGLSLLPLLAAGSPVLVDTIHNNAAPLISSSNAKEIPDSYMVIFKNHVSERDAAVHHSWVQDVHLSQRSRKQELRKRSQTPFTSDDTIFEGLRHTYNIPGGFLGYAGHFHEDVIEEVRRHPDVSTPIPHPSIPFSHQDKHQWDGRRHCDGHLTLFTPSISPSPSRAPLSPPVSRGIGSSRACLLRLNTSNVTRKSTR